MKLKETDFEGNQIVVMKKVKQSKYNPHQSSKECRRRMKQIAAGTLNDSSVTISARYKAAGLSSLDDVSLVKVLD